MKRAILLAGVTAIFGCSSGGSVDIGDEDVTTLGQRLEDFAGSWDGYAETYQFYDQSDRIRISLDASGQGTIEVGDTPLHPAPTDFGVGYPSGIPSRSSYYAPEQPRPGFLLPIRDAHLNESRIRFGVDALAPFRPWCEMQTPKLAYADATTTTYLCVVAADDPLDMCLDENPEIQAAAPVDCGKEHMCTSLCVCTETECTVPAPSDPGGWRVNVDATLIEGGSTLEGTLTFPEGLSQGPLPIPIRLMRQ